MSSLEKAGASGDGRACREVRADTASRPDGRSSEKATRYRGVVDWWGTHVWAEGDGVRARLPHHGEDSSAFYVWGRPGLGARALARALLFDATGSAVLSERCCRDFVHEIVAQLPEREFVLERGDILAWLAQRPGPSTA